ncbi:alpha/beta fold hydrolase [Rhodococcus pseudokoreensis]|uniref:Alpha/beta fold hydrolase n=1 Tax=Rhodococcus pseudokoreensis TaxID=2811421 RepID=A0A974WA60_9NOCA|nr:alpha/beta fold hydrolase [Rhodococcus pseudokoreensis]QSE94169.1 alpha/beta fold hydrolase [Rhodococcus pseudokoreensis]
MITVLCCRGIGESMGDGSMLANVTKHLDPRRFRVVEVPWSAQYGPVPAPLGSSFDTSLRTGRLMLLDYIRRDPNPVVIIGYSGGGALAGNVAAEIARGEHPALDVRGVGLISDPLRPMTRTDYTWGIAGKRWINADFPVWHLADPSDVITSCPEDSPLRTFADQSASFALADLRSWGWDLVDRIRRRRWQATIRDWHNAPEIWRAYTQALHGADGYLRRGDHTSYHLRRYPGSTRTYTEWLADRINEIREAS